MSMIGAIILLGMLIFIHELGHFSVAKWCGVRVEVFSIGFGRSIAGIQLGQTRYQLGLIPLGGYVKMLGESLDGPEGSGEQPADAYSAQSVWKRIAIVAAGPGANALLAILLLALIQINGVWKLQPVIGEVLPDTAAASVGLQQGDRILQIGQSPVAHWDDIVERVQNSPGVPLQLRIERNERLLSIEVQPDVSESTNVFGEPRQIGLLGIKPDPEQSTQVQYAPWNALANATIQTWDIAALTFQSILKIFQKVVPTDSIGGPIMIVQMASDQIEQGINPVLFFTALISINLAILNLLPIPVLDGGHLMFFLWEAITGTLPSPRVRDIAARIGISLLLALMFLAFYNDIRRLVLGIALPGSAE